MLPFAECCASLVGLSSASRRQSISHNVWLCDFPVAKVKACSKACGPVVTELKLVAFGFPSLFPSLSFKVTGYAVSPCLKLKTKVALDGCGKSNKLAFLVSSPGAQCDIVRYNIRLYKTHAPRKTGNKGHTQRHDTTIVEWHNTSEVERHARYNL